MVLAQHKQPSEDLRLQAVSIPLWFSLNPMPKGAKLQSIAKFPSHYGSRSTLTSGNLKLG